MRAKMNDTECMSVVTASLIHKNRSLHRLLRAGVPVEYSRPDRMIGGDRVRLVVSHDANANYYLAAHQFVMFEGQRNWRPASSNAGRSSGAYPSIAT